MYRNNVNISDLINRFEVTNDDDFDETVKYVGAQSFVRKYARRQSGDENFGNDESRSLVKAYAGGSIKSDKFIDNSTVYVRRTNVSMSGAKEFIKQLLHKISALLEMISKFPFPRMSVVSFGLTSLLAVFIAPRSFTERVLYPGFKIIFTIIYPAYRSFKAVRNKNLKEYLKWLVFWIVYAFFTCFELISDALLNWFPFYYEIKVIFLIWLLGPSSRGSMKIYKNCIHPMLVHREQEIDDIIQLAQDHGYMQVFRLSSKSVNYANRIIMQDSKADKGFIVSQELMKNMSLSNLSDAGIVQSIDNDAITQMRRFSLDNAPVYRNKQSNYSYEDLDSRRRPSFDYKYDEGMSSGYSSPVTSYQRYPVRKQQQQGAFIENVTSETNQPKELNFTSRKSSVNDLTADEIMTAYNKLQQDKMVDEKAVEAQEDTIKVDPNYLEFLKWMECKKTASVNQVANEKVIPKVDEINVSSCSDESPLLVGDVIVDRECEKPSVSGEVDVNKSEPENSEEIEREIPASDTKIEKTESDQEVDFNEFKDAISESDEENEFLKVPLIIKEDDDKNDTSEPSKQPESADSVIPTVVEEKVDTVNATLTLTNDPLEIVTKLSTSNISLASSQDGSDHKIKRPAKHGKGRAPQPPSTSTNVIDGYYFDELKQKHFKETEL